MSDIPDMILKARREIGDLSVPFSTEYAGDGVTTVVLTPAKPLDTTGLTVSILSPAGNTTLAVNTDYTVDGQSGTITLLDPIPLDTVLLVAGNAYRYFSDDDWTDYFTTAMDQHFYQQTDEMGQLVLLSNMPPVQEYAVILLACTLVLYALINDASFDINISTPEGVSIPRGQRVEQLWHMLAGRQDQYNKLCANLNVGLSRIEMRELRRKSLMTNRFVPVYETQEYQDTRWARNIFPTIDSDGTDPEPVINFDQIINLRGMANQDFSTTVVLGFDVTGLIVTGAVRRYPYALTPMIFMTVTILDVPTGTVQLTINGRLMYYAGVSKFWDLQTTDSNGNVTTHVGGTFDAVQQGNPAATYAGPVL